MSRTSTISLLVLFVAAGTLGYVVYASLVTEAENNNQPTIQSTETGYKLTFARMDHSHGDDPIRTSAEGSARIISGDDTFVVKLDVTGMKQQSQYNAHLHRGTCQEGGAGGLQLNPLRSDAKGNGSSSTEVRASDLNPTMNHLIMLHNPTGHHVLCADLPPIDRILNS